MLEVFRGYFGITEQRHRHEARARRSPGALLLLDDGFRELLPLLFDFLGVPDPERPAPHGPRGAQRQLFAFAAPA